MCLTNEFMLTDAYWVKDTLKGSASRDDMIRLMTEQSSGCTVSYISPVHLWDLWDKTHGASILYLHMVSHDLLA